MMVEIERFEIGSHADGSLVGCRFYMRPHSTGSWVSAIDAVKQLTAANAHILQLEGLIIAVADRLNNRRHAAQGLDPLARQMMTDMEKGRDS